MSRKRFQVVAELFREAMALPPKERAEFLQRSTGGDDSIVREVEALLARNSAPPTYLRDSRVGEAASARARRAIEPPPSSAPVPSRIAKFDILDMLGEGGMGVVYRARQLTPNRLVAVKVLRAGGSSAAAQRRFQFEADALGRLQHPNIAQIFDAGVADDGESARPYFAMELVEGRPLAAFVRERDLSLHDRLRLMIKICRAVDHAHQQGIVHRDLKPANILVTHAGEPKVLDFGIAKAMAARDEGPRTQLGQMVGTVPYMSPEQINGEIQSIGPPTDVYALGIVMFELLEGEVPYRLDRLSPEEAVQVITTEKPTPTLSTSVLFRADLEGIIGRCLAPRKEDRYPTAEAIAQDIERFISNRPVTARGRSTTYRMKKFLIRHRLAAIFGLVLLVGASGGGWLVARALQDDPPPVDPTVTPPEPDPIPVEEMVQDLLDMHYHEAIAAIGDWAKAGRLASVITYLNTEIAGQIQANPGTNRLRTAMAMCHQAAGNHAEAERLLRRTLEGTNQTAPIGPRAITELISSNLLGWAVLEQDRGPEAKAIFTRLGGMDRVLNSGGPAPPRIILFDAKIGMGLALLRAGDPAGAEAPIERGIAGLNELVKDVAHPLIQRGYRAMIELLEQTDRRNEALAWRQKLID